jgi:hypothetical protein
MATNVHAIPTSLPAISAAIACHEKALEYLRAVRQMLENFDPQVDPQRYAGMRKAVALEKYLVSKNGIATMEECVRALVDGGCDMGDRPHANLATTISTNRKLFVVSGDRVLLVKGLENRAA